VIDEYTCENCHGTFEKAWSDEEALAEAEAHGFEEPYGVLCDDCHQRFMVWARKHGLVS
jgi:nitrate/TMAO reductase-like tetraheme cytochrome c subunit